MAGKMTDGTDTQYDFRTCKAYAEGVEARVAAVSPTNPHASGTPEFTAWAQGVTDCAAGGAANVDRCVAGYSRAAAT